MPDNSSPAQGPDDLPTIFGLPLLTIGTDGVISGELAVVTEDGRRMRITGVRYVGYNQAEITVTEEGA